MDFQFTEEQLALREAARTVFDGMVDPDRVEAIETTDDRVDTELWQALATADLLGIGTPEELGGIGHAMVAIGQVLEEQGRVVAPVPLHATLVGGVLPIATFGSEVLQRRWLPGVAAGEVILTAALADACLSPTGRPKVEATRTDGGWTLNGTASAVPFAHVAHAAVVPARFGDDVVVLVVPLDADGVSLERTITTNRAVHPHLHLESVVVDDEGHLGGNDVLERSIQWAQTGLALLQVGVGEAALEQTAAYLNERVQFGRTLSSFQGTMLRAADAGINVEAIRVTAWQAAWRLDEGLDATEAVLVTKWQAAERGQSVVHATQHLHGGTGADITYPIHRYFLWGKQIEVELGSPSLQLARLGQLIADEPEKVLSR